MANRLRKKFAAGNPRTSSFTDIAMPGEWDGLRLAKWIADDPDRDIHVVLTSGYHEYQTQDLEFEFVSKPYTRRRLVDALQRSG